MTGKDLHIKSMFIYTHTFPTTATDSMKYIPFLDYVRSIHGYLENQVWQRRAETYVLISFFNYLQNLINDIE